MKKFLWLLALSLALTVPGLAENFGPLPEMEYAALTGLQFQDPMAYYGLGLWDLEERTETKCMIHMERVEKDFLDPFAQAVKDLNPAFTMQAPEVMSFSSYYEYYGKEYVFTAPANADGTVPTFRISLVIKNQYIEWEYILKWEWENGVTLADTGVRGSRAESTLAKPSFAPTRAVKEDLRLEGPRFQDPLTYYGLTIWDLESAESEVVHRSAQAYIEKVPEMFLEEFVRDMAYLNPDFRLWSVVDDDWYLIDQGRQIVCTYDYVPADGSPNLVRDDFVIELRFKGADGVTLEWSWQKGIELVATGLTAQVKPTSLSTKTFFLPPGPSDYAGTLSGNQFVDPAAYYQLTDRLNGKKSFDVMVGSSRSVLWGFVYDVEKINPEFKLVYATENDYTYIGRDYWLTYFYRYEPADGSYGAADPDAPWHFQIRVWAELFSGVSHISWEAAEGIELVDAKIDPMMLLDPIDLPENSGNSGGSSDNFYNREKEEEKPKPCYHCYDGTERCSRCDGDGGKWEYTSVPNYSGHGQTESERWIRCDKCGGDGKVDCHWCGGDRYIP